MATIRTQWQRIRNYIWLVCGYSKLYLARVWDGVFVCGTGFLGDYR